MKRGPYRKDPAKEAKRLAKFEAMAALYRSGADTREIAKLYGCSPQYIDECLKKLSVRAEDGGKHIACLANWGCTHEEYVEIKSVPGAIIAFVCQRYNAEKVRGVGFELTLPQWWKIWSESGRWEQRGRASEQYCMCRRGDIGPYAVGNVYIATNRHNLTHRYSLTALLTEVEHCS